MTGDNDETPTEEGLPSKRFSPWRQPKDTRDPESAASLTWSSRNTTTTTHTNSKQSVPKEKSTRKLFQESVLVQIPLNVTADLGVAMKRTRAKRVEGLLQAFPHLNNKKTTSTAQEDDDNAPMELTDGTKGDTTFDKSEEDHTKKASAKKKRNQPQPGDFGNIVDYLEAKYVQGVMLDDSGSENDDNDEGQGSVYSETSFLDDTDLQRTVAEQVLAQTTTTKLELRDDDEFFVNVGELEVEETELTKEEYDPLQDTKTKSPKRKRKADDGKDGHDSATTATKKKKKMKAELLEKQDKLDSFATSKNLKTKIEAELQKPDTGKLGTSKEHQKKSKECKKIYENLYQKLVEMIKKASPEELPKRKTKEKVSIKCPSDKKPGDSVIFANPHVKGQKLKVKIPDNCKPGGQFKVTVPVPADDDDDTDYNKLNRAFYYALDNYSRAFDDWCDAEGDYRKAIDDKEFTAHFEKRNKFDKLVHEFPKDLKTRVDKAYLQKILRRARQSKSKKEGHDKSDLSVASDKAMPTVSTRVPVKSKEFATVEFNMDDFKLTDKND